MADDRRMAGLGHTVWEQGFRRTGDGELARTRRAECDGSICYRQLPRDHRFNCFGFMRLVGLLADAITIKHGKHG